MLRPARMKFSVWTAFLLPPPRYARRPSHDPAAAVSIQMGEPAVSPREADPEIEHVVDRSEGPDFKLGTLPDPGPGAPAEASPSRGASGPPLARDPKASAGPFTAQKQLGAKRGNACSGTKRHAVHAVAVTVLRPARTSAATAMRTPCAMRAAASRF